MRKLAPPTTFLILFAALVYGGDGHAQRKRTLVWKPRPTPSPTPIPQENVLDQIPDAEPEWKYIGFAGRGVMLYYNTQRITYPDVNVRRAWIKAQPLGKARDKWTAGLEDSSHSYTDYSYTVSQEEYDCVAVKARLLRATDYTFSGGVIHSARAPGRWYELVPDSLGEAVLKAVCSHKE